MDMEMAMAAAVVPHLPGLQDSNGEYIKALFTSLARR